MARKKSSAASKKTEIKSEGLGDTLEKITEATGIKKAVEVFHELTGFDCGCESRKEKLNRLFSYRKQPECMTKEQFELWGEYKNFDKRKVRLYVETVYPIIAKLHSEIFKHRYKEPCGCNPRIWQTWTEDLNKLYKVYQEELNDKQS